MCYRGIYPIKEIDRNEIKNLLLYRPQKNTAQQYERIAGRLRAEIIRLIEHGIVYFGAGGALGFDTLAAQHDVAIYEDITARCDKFIYTSQEYTRSCMFERNRHLVDGSSVCVCYLTEPTSGTAYTVEYAKPKGLCVINVAKS